MITTTRREYFADRRRSRRGLALHAIAVLLLSAYPLSVTLRANLGIVPIGMGTIIWVCAVNLALATTLFIVLRLVTADTAARAVWIGVFFLLFGGYNLSLQLAAALGWPIQPERLANAIGYTLLSAAIATIAVRPWRARKRDPVPLLIVGIVLFGTNAAVGASRAFTFSAVTPGSTGAWQPAAAQLIAEVTSGSERRTGAPTPDIYYVVVDGFGRADVLRRIYDLDLGELITFLRTRGFEVPQEATSNYSQTYLSLASMLNLSYLDRIAGAMGRLSSNRVPLDYLINRNALMELAKRAGYEVVAIGSDYIATERVQAADLCICEQFGSSMTEQAVFAATPLVALSLGPRAFDAHRRKILNTFDELERVRRSSRPSFVFAHIVAPHPPFVFTSNGGPAPSIGLFMFQDGSTFQGSREDYRQGYRDQVRFMASRLRTLVDRLLSRQGPRPVIVIQGDHGPGLGLDVNSMERTDVDERMGILAAYSFPDSTARPYSTMTPVNAGRLLANAYLGTELPPLDDKSYFSVWERPYDFVPIVSTRPVDSHENGAAR